MESIKVSSTLRINAGRKESGLLWQPRFFDRALRSVKEYCEKVEYVHLNAVRAGLVKRAAGWPWLSVHDYAANLSRAVNPNRILAVDRIPLPADAEGVSVRLQPSQAESLCRKDVGRCSGRGSRTGRCGGVQVVEDCQRPLAFRDRCDARVPATTGPTRRSSSGWRSPTNPDLRIRPRLPSAY